MTNIEPDFFRFINGISSKPLRWLSYLLCSKNLKHPLIKRDMHYPTFSWKDQGQYGLAFYENLKIEEKALLESIDQKTALGRYTERLVAAWFMINPNYELLAFNQQLVEGDVTIGEIDFLLYEKLNRKYIHLEFALKFYLAYKEENEWRYIGPKSRDTFEGKSRKLIEHQLKLSYRFKHLLNENLRQHSYEPRLLMKGQIFYPFSSTESNSWWLRRSEVLKLLKLKMDRVVLLRNRVEWIFPFDQDRDAEVFNKEEFVELISDGIELPLMGVIEGNEKCHLIMVVEDDWPKATI